MLLYGQRGDTVAPGTKFSSAPKRQKKNCITYQLKPTQLLQYLKITTKKKQLNIFSEVHALLSHQSLFLGVKFLGLTLHRKLKLKKKKKKKLFLER